MECSGNNIYVVLMVSEKTLATDTCTFNNGQRVHPLPNTYNGKKTVPIWNDEKWSREELIGAVKYSYLEDDYPAGRLNDPTFDFVLDGMTPLLEVILEAQDRTRNKIIPGRPKKT
jgi:hypothetical protein